MNAITEACQGQPNDWAIAAVFIALFVLVGFIIWVVNR